jgi:hypothetical protein
MTALKELARNEAARIIALLIVLIGAKAVLLGYGGFVKPLPWPTGTARAWTNNALETISSRELNKEAREALTAGYYEGLINEGSRLSGMNRLVNDTRVPKFEDNSQPDRRETHDFLFYELIPNSDIADYRDHRARYRLKTNSAGFADVEYAVEKPAGVRRIALMGDSIARGQGAPFGETFEALLERTLDSRVKETPGLPDGVEILNFAVGSYNITQQMEIAHTRATAYHPDAYVYCLSPLSVYRSWARHLALVMNAGIDLKYDFLRQLVKESGVKANDSMGVFDSKMSRFRLSTIRWALTEMQALARREGASMLVVLVPDVSYGSQSAESFLGIQEILRELGVPSVPLIDSFDGLGDLSPYRVADTDRHPNALGHKRLFDRLYQQIDADPRLLSALIGASAPSSSTARR